MIALSVPSEDSLSVLAHQARLAQVPISEFREPDIGHQLTAVAFAPSLITKKLLAQCSLAGKETQS